MPFCDFVPTSGSSHERRPLLSPMCHFRAGSLTCGFPDSSGLTPQRCQVPWAMQESPGPGPPSPTAQLCPQVPPCAAPRAGLLGGMVVRSPGLLAGPVPVLVPATRPADFSFCLPALAYQLCSPRPWLSSDLGSAAVVH